MEVLLLYDVAIPFVRLSQLEQGVVIHLGLQIGKVVGGL